ncbi:GNAT family N-acetyltransferase [Palleronia aestuarii]|nr:GNAT family N-acetyltransferase [Palleronia aestuarii]
MTFLVLEKRAAARTKPQIRDATQSDADAIRACAEAAHAHHVEIIGRRPAPMDMDVAAAIRAARTRVVEGPGGTLAGYAVARVNDDHMELESVAVRPEAAGRGVGGALIRDCEAEAWRRGLPAVRLYTNAAMTENLRLYPHLGYRETDRRHEDGFDRVYYEKARPSALNG